MKSAHIFVISQLGRGETAPWVALLSSMVAQLARTPEFSGTDSASYDDLV